MGGSDRNGIGSYAEEAGVTQADLSGETHQKIEAETRQREDKDQCRYPVIIGRWEHQRQQQDNNRDRYGRRQAMIEQCAHAHTRSTWARPSRPWGTTNSTARITRNATASL